MKQVTVLGVIATRYGISESQRIFLRDWISVHDEVHCVSHGEGNKQALRVCAQQKARITLHPHPNEVSNVCPVVIVLCNKSDPNAEHDLTEASEYAREHGCTVRTVTSDGALYSERLVGADAVIKARF